MTLKKATEDTRRWKHLPSLWIGRINSVKMVVLWKLIYRIDGSTIKFPLAFFIEVEKQP